MLGLAGEGGAKEHENSHPIVKQKLIRKSC